MLAVISPSKTLNESIINTNLSIKSKLIGNKSTSKPKFEKDANYLISELKKLDITDLMNLMKISDKLAELNFIRYKSFRNADKNPCGYLFKGEVFRGLDIESLDINQVEYLNNHVFILSGLYGYLRFLDEIKPYRLEMGIPLYNKVGPNLYAYWDDRIYKALVRENKPNYIINLASKEYSKALNLDKSKVPVIDIEFLQKRKGKLQQIAIYSKRARGLMARFIAVSKANDPNDLKVFDYEGYSFNEKLSTKSKYVFTRNY